MLNIFSENRGKVMLVGAGPGDPGLLTLRGYQSLQQAEVVVHDRLVNNTLKSFAPQAEWIDVGKQPNHHPVPQEKINALLVELGLAGKWVVRLKGGDPFVFGRGGEEARALAEHSIPFEIVPGVSSAIAAPAYAGIPITHRGMACSATIITGHRADFCSDPQQDWSRAVQGGDTLVFLMGIQNLPALVDQMQSAGRLGDTPVAIIEQATYPAQKVVTGTLDTIIELAACIHPPAVKVVGEYVRLRKELTWFDCLENRPLLGMTIVDTQPSFAQTYWKSEQYSIWPPVLDEFKDQLSSLGAEVMDLPAYHLEPNPAALDQAMARLQPGAIYSRPDWIWFANAAAVTCFYYHLETRGHDTRVFGGLWLGAADAETAGALARCGLKADRVNPPANAPDNPMRGQRVLLIGSTTDCVDGTGILQAQGAQVEAVAVLQDQPAELNPDRVEGLRSGSTNLITFRNPAAIDGILARLGPSTAKAALSQTIVLCAGAHTLARAQVLDIRVDIAVPEGSAQSLFSTILDWKSSQLKRIPLDQ